MKSIVGQIEENIFLINLLYAFFGRLKKIFFPSLEIMQELDGLLTYVNKMSFFLLPYQLLPTNNNRKSNKKHLLSIIVGLFIYDVYFIDY